MSSADQGVWRISVHESCVAYASRHHSVQKSKVACSTTHTALSTAVSKATPHARKQAGIHVRDVMTDSTAHPDTICVKVWAGMDMTVLAHAIFGVLLDCSTASWQMRLQPQAHEYVSDEAPILRKSTGTTPCKAVLCSAVPRLADQKLYTVCHSITPEMASCST